MRKVIHNSELLVIFLFSGKITTMQDDTDFMLNWLRTRGITDQVITEAKIHWGSQSTLGPCIVIPVCDVDGAFLFNKYRRDPRFDLKPKYLYDAGGITALYGVESIKDAPSVIITEGELDSLVARSAYLPAISSTGGALAFKEGWLDLLKGREVILIFDNDDAGAQGMVRVLSFLPHAKIVFIPEQPNVKDVSDYVSRGGNLAELVRTAVHFGSLEEVKEDKARRESVWLPTRFHAAYLEVNTPKIFPNRKVKTDLPDILKAKEYPIERLIEFKQGKACCLWHNEKDPSLHYYREQNVVYCFGGCGKSFDAIDVVRQIRGCSFSEAVKLLL